jgi:hypothetical protein
MSTFLPIIGEPDNGRLTSNRLGVWRVRALGATIRGESISSCPVNQHVVRTPKAQGPVGTNVQWVYKQMFTEVVNNLPPKYKDFILP